MSEIHFDLISVVVFLFVAMAFVFATLAVGRFIRPTKPSREKNSVYECGERPIGRAWFNFNPRFYIIALIFLVFDVEIAFMVPVATVFKESVAQGQGAIVYVEIAVFLAILFIGLVYVWRKGDLDWLKRLD